MNLQSQSVSDRPRVPEGDKQGIYLDYAATTPVDPRVMAEMQTCLGLEGVFANAASDHLFGQAAHAAVERARAQVAQLIHTVPRQIIFSSGATEAINLALKGAADYYQNQGRHIVTCTTEHSAVLDTCRYLETVGYEVTYLEPLPNGLYTVEQFKQAFRTDTILLSIMFVNNETGMIQDIAALGACARAQGIKVHVDAAQSMGKIPIDVQALEIDLLSFSAHKFYGPKGVGGLYVNETPRIRLRPQLHGGGQERGLRAGTLATHQIVGLGAAAALAQVLMAEEFAYITRLRDRFWQGIADLPGVYANTDFTLGVPHILNVRFERHLKEDLLHGLGGIAVSVASACRSTRLEPSYVLKAMGLSHAQASSSLRFSFGRFTTEEEIESAIQQIRKYSNNRARTFTYSRHFRPDP